METTTSSSDQSTLSTPPASRFGSFGGWWSSSSGSGSGEGKEERDEQAHEEEEGGATEGEEEVETQHVGNGIHHAREATEEEKKGMIFHNVSDSGPTGSASSWFSDIFSLPSIPTSILNSLASTSTTTFPPSSSGFKWGFGGASQVREEVKRPGQEGDLRVEDLPKPTPHPPTTPSNSNLAVPTSSQQQLSYQSSLLSLDAPSTSFYSAPSSTLRDHSSPAPSPPSSVHEGDDDSRPEPHRRKSRDLRDFERGEEYGDGTTTTSRRDLEDAREELNLGLGADGEQEKVGETRGELGVRRKSVFLEVPEKGRRGSTASAPVMSSRAGEMDVKGVREGKQRKSSMLKRVMNSLQPSSSSSSSNPNLQSSTSLASTIQPTDSTSTRRPSTRAMSFASSTTNGGNTTKTSVPKRKYVKVHSKGVKKGNNALGKVFLAQTIDTNAWPTPPPPPSTSSAISQSSSSPRKQNHRHSQSTSPPPPSIQTDSSLQFPAIPRTDSPLSLPPSPSPAPSPTTTLSPPSSPTKPTSSLKTSTPAKRSSSFLRPLRLSRTDSSSTAASTVVTSPTTLNAKDGGARPDAMPPSPTTSSMRKKTSSLSEGGSGTKEATGAGVKGKGKALWCLAWSLDGRYLATAGQDAIVRIYRTLSSDVVPEESVTNISTGAGAGQNGGNAANVVEETPFRVWEGHKDGVLSLSWSKNGFLLTSSMDKTVRLWHTSRENCLTVFQHPDFVTSVTFHPRDDRFFLSGGCDFKVRIWSIVEKKVRHVVEVPEMITAVAFSVDGKTAAAGTFTGKVYFLTDSLAYLRSIKVRSTRGKNSKGKKITNIQFLAASTSGKDERVLITSNDSRVRLYRLNDSALEMKFKGHENESSQIGATIGDDGRWIICGSEDGHVYLWGTDWDVKDREEARYQQFEADPSVVSCAVLAPMNARLLLASSGDEIYASQGPSSYFPPVINLSAAPTRVSLNPTLSRSTTLSIGTLSPRSETDPLPALDTAGTFDSMETYASLPILAIATMHGTVKIYRVDNSIANSAQSLQNRGSVDSLASRGQPGERRASLVPSSRSGH